MCPRNMETHSMPAFMPLSRNFQSADSISTIRRAGGNGPMLQEDSLIPSASLPFAFTLNSVVGFDNL